MAAAIAAAVKNNNKGQPEQYGKVIVTSHNVKGSF